LFESVFGQVKKVCGSRSACPGNPALFQALLFFTDGLEAGGKVRQETAVQHFVLPSGALRVKGCPGSRSEIRERLPAEADGLEKRGAGGSSARGPEGLGAGGEFGRQRTGGLGGVAGQGIGGMGADPVTQKMPTRMVGLFSVIAENGKDRFEIDFTGVSGE
jgi:hypothetical protein